MGWIVIVFLVITGIFIFLVDPSGFFEIIRGFSTKFLLFFVSAFVGMVLAHITKNAISRWLSGEGGKRYDDRYTRVEYDSEGCIIGYRYFGITYENGRYILTSVGRGLDVDGGLYPSLLKEADRIPTTRNKHGIYAAKTPDSPILEAYSRHPGLVKARVRLSGKIVEHDYSYRAQYCEIVQIMDSKMSFLLRDYNRR